MEVKVIALKAEVNKDLPTIITMLEPFFPYEKTAAKIAYNALKDYIKLKNRIDEQITDLRDLQEKYDNLHENVGELAEAIQNKLQAEKDIDYTLKLIQDPDAES